MKMKTSELTRAALDWAVQEALLKSLPQPELGLLIHYVGYGKEPLPYSTVWSQGGPIIEREGISMMKAHPTESIWGARYAWSDSGRDRFGPTPLIAAMRCFVASRLGDEVEIPEELT